MDRSTGKADVLEADLIRRARAGDDAAYERLVREHQEAVFRLAYLYLGSADDAPENISGDGYLITRFYEQSPGRYVAFDEVRYYPNPDGGRGYLNYVGIVNGWSEYDGKWFRPSASGEAALQSLIAPLHPEGIAGTEAVETEASTSSILSLFLNAFAAFASH